MQNTEISPQAAQELARYEAERTIFNLRKQAAAEIERLIAFMDETDGYTTTELEEAVDDRGCCDDELEKNLSGIHAHHVPDAAGDESGDLEDDRDDEYSLGSLQSNGGDQTRWCAGYDGDLEDSGLGDGDLEEACDDEGAQDADREPSLGWTEGQSAAGIVPPSDGMDREQGDCEASVIAARARGQSRTPGVQIDHHGHIRHIVGATDRQMQSLGVEWVR